MRNTCPKTRQVSKYPLACGEDSAECYSVPLCENSVEYCSEYCAHSCECHLYDISVAYEKCKLDTGVSVKGRLNHNLHYWESVLQAPEPILSIIRQGYILPFVSVPEARYFKNQGSAFVHKEFVTDTVQGLLEHGCIKRVTSQPIVCSPLLVVVSNSGKKRLVINLRYINYFLWKEKFKYEDMRTVLLLLEKEDFLCTFDLKSGYHHVDIHTQSQLFLGFTWEQSYYVFTVLPFGLSLACYVFTKLMRPLVKLWRSKGIRCVVDIDDGIIAAAGRERAQQDSDFVSRFCS